MQSLSSFFSESARKNAGFSVSLTLNMSLLTLDYFLLKWLTESTKKTEEASQNETALYGSCFAVAIMLTGLKFAWTAKNTRQYRNEIIEDDPHIRFDKQISRNDLIQATTKLAFGAFGWQLAFILAQYWMGYEYDSDFTPESWDEKFVTWLATGIGSMIFLNLGVLLHQGLLFHCDNSAVSVLYLSIIALQFCLSVLIADGLWLAFTDAAAAISEGFAHDVICAAFYLLLSFIFKNIHNTFNYLHSDGDYYRKVVCDNKFVSVLWSAYFGFKFLTDLFYIMTQLKFTQFKFVDVFFACLVAGVATAILPLIIQLGHYAQMEEDYDEVSSLRNPLLDADEDEENFEQVSQKWTMVISTLPEAIYSYAQRYSLYTPCVVLSQSVDEIVQLASDTYPQR